MNPRFLAALLALLLVARAAASSEPGNKIEPLSNGLRLSMSKAEIVGRFGPPTETTWDSRSFGYEAFFVACGGERESIWHLTLKRGVRMSSGIAVGVSRRRDVQAAFGCADECEYQQYRLAFSYGPGDALAAVKIDPARGEFEDYRKAAGPAETGAAKAPGRPAPALVGTWQCVAPSWSSGVIELKDGGVYTRPGGVAGRYVVADGGVIFDGGLRAWNGGRARLDGGNLVFEWADPDGSRHYFAFRKAR